MAAGFGGGAQAALPWLHHHDTQRSRHSGGLLHPAVQHPVRPLGQPWHQIRPVEPAGAKPHAPRTLRARPRP
jgi:hypothetical protein